MVIKMLIKLSRIDEQGENFNKGRKHKVARSERAEENGNLNVKYTTGG